MYKNDLLIKIQLYIIFPSASTFSSSLIELSSECETYGLLNLVKQEMLEEVTRKCVRIVRVYTAKKTPIKIAK